MARISGVDLSKNKQGGIALTYIYGIGKTTANKILTSNGIDPATKVKDWNDEQVNGIIRYIADKLKVEGELRGEVQQNIKRLQDIGAYRGIRHRKGLPVRGQRTKTNSRTRKGKRKTVANKKMVTK
jgi:small subunit ribosomal protein S13